MKKKLKIIPQFNNEVDEVNFWNTHDSTEYIDWNKATHISFPNLKLSTKSITIRVPEHLLDSLKTIANKKDVPYQSLIKIILADKVREEFSQYKIK